MKLLSILTGLCLIFSFSTKTFACPCDKHKAEVSATGITVADAKDAGKTDAKTGDHECQCKNCDHSKDGGKSCENHKDGKACGCSEKEKKAKS